MKRVNAVKEYLAQMQGVRKLQAEGYLSYGTATALIHELEAFARQEESKEKKPMPRKNAPYPEWKGPVVQYYKHKLTSDDAVRFVMKYGDFTEKLARKIVDLYWPGFGRARTPARKYSRPNPSRTVYVDYYGGNYYAFYENSDGDKARFSSDDRAAVVRWAKRILSPYRAKVVFSEGCPRPGRVEV